LPKRGIFGRPIGKCKRLARYACSASLSARGIVYDKRERHCAACVASVNKRRRAGVSRQALAFADGPAEYGSFRQSSKINILLTITKIVKWQMTFLLSLTSSTCTQGLIRLVPDTLYIHTRVYTSVLPYHY